MADFKRNATGTPYVSDPEKRNKDGRPRMVLYARPSGFTKQIENTYNLQKWSERKIVTGLAHAVADPLASHDVSLLLKSIRDGAGDIDSDADSLVAKAKDFAQSSLAADRGTWVHSLTEYADRGDTVPESVVASGAALGIDPGLQVRLADTWRALLADHGLEVLATELPVVNDEFRTAGTLDRVVRLTRALTFTTADGEVVELPAGTVAVLDLKTGSLSSLHYWNNYASQVYLYASSVGYDLESDQRRPLPWTVSQRWGLLAHLDAKAAIDGAADIAQLLLVDLDAGRHACTIAADAKAWAARQGVFARFHSVAAPVDLPPAVEQPGAGAALPASRPGADLTPQQQKAIVPAVDEGGDTRSGKDWVDLQSRYEELPDTGKEFLKHLMRESLQCGVSWHRKERTSDRRWHLYDAAITLAGLRYDIDWSCEVLRALVAEVVGADWPLFPVVKTGHSFGSLNADEAERLAAAVRRLEAGGYVADLTRDVLELRRAA